MKKIIWILAIILTNSFVSNAQAPKSAAKSKKIDTVLSAQAATDAIELIAQKNVQQYRDSLEEVTLRLQIENTAEIKTRRALEEQLAKKHREDSLRHEKLKAQIENSRKDATGYPVVVAGDTVRVVYTTFGTLKPSERASITTEKIKSISRMYMPMFDTLAIANEGLGVEIVFNDNILATVTQSDAIWEGRDMTEIAKEIANATHTAIIKYKELTSFMTIAKQVGLSLLVILVAFFLIRFINKVFKHKISRFLFGKIGIWFTGWKFKDYEFMNAKKQVKTTLAVIKVLRFALSVTIIFIALPLLFSIFPITQRFADIIFDWVFTPIKNIFWAIINYLPKLFIVIIIWIVMRFVIKGVRYIMDEIAAGKLKIKGFYPDWANSTFNILRIAIYAFAVVLIFPYLPGSDSDVFKGVSVFLGVLVSIGSSSMINNMVSGLVITYMRPFKVGDHIKIGEVTGDVLEKTAYVTRILTHKQEVVTIPNSSILSSSVVNYTIMAEERQGVIFHTSLSVGYEIPWRDVQKHLIEAANRSKFVLKKPAPFVLQTSLDDFYVMYQLCAYTKHPEKQATINSQLHMNIQDVFNENGIELLSAHYRACRDGSEITIPKGYQFESQERPNSEEI